MPIDIPGTPIRVFQAPKVMTRAVRRMVKELEAENPGANRFAAAGQQPRLHAVWPNMLFNSAQLDGKKLLVALFRDPIERFESLYRSKVLAHPGDTSGQWEKAATKGWAPPRDLEDFACNLDNWRREVKVIRRHSLPQVDWLGPDPSVYHYHYQISEIESLEKLISLHLGAQVSLPIVGQSSREGFHGCTPETKLRLRQIYRDDYAFINAIPLTRAPRREHPR